MIFRALLAKEAINLENNDGRSHESVKQWAQTHIWICLSEETFSSLPRIKDILPTELQSLFRIWIKYI